MNLNAITVDVEDYYHARNIELAIGRKCWPKLESRVEESTQKVLQLFEKANAKGTFFVLGNVARKHKNLVREIASSGHEIASHGFRHHLAYDQSPKAFFRDVRTSKKLLEDIIGAEVLGYRAPNFSIKKENFYAYDKLIEAGYKYDSSLYPVWHPRYGNFDRPIKPHQITREAGSIWVLPLAVWNCLGKFKLPAAGGAYWRLFPTLYTKIALRQITKTKNPCICYLHPWEIDSGQPKFSELTPLNRLRHYGGIEGLQKKINYYLEQYQVKTLKEILAETKRAYGC